MQLARLTPIDCTQPVRYTILDEDLYPCSIIHEEYEVLQSFLDACERIGFLFNHNTARNAIRERFDIWYDAWKRDRIPTGGEGHDPSTVLEELGCRIAN